MELQQISHGDGIKKNVSSRIRAHFSNLSASERRVAEFVTVAPDRVIQMTLAELGKEAGVSDATALRFVRSIGFQGFNDLKMALVADSVSPASAVFSRIDDADDINTLIEKVILANIELLQDTLVILDRKDIAEAVELITAADCIYIFAVGTSTPVARDLHNRLFRLGLNTVVETDAYLIAMQASLAKKGSVMIQISRSGEPPTLHDAIHLAKKHDIPCIAITTDRSSTLAKLSDISLLAVSEEIRRESMASYVPLFTICEILYVAVALHDKSRTVLNEKLIWEANRYLENFGQQKK